MATLRSPSIKTRAGRSGLPRAGAIFSSRRAKERCRRVTATPPMPRPLRTSVARAIRKRRCRVEKRMDGFRERATPGVTSICVSARNSNFPGAWVPPFVARDRVRPLRTRLQPLLRLLLQTQVGLLDMWALEQALARAFQRDPPVFQDIAPVAELQRAQHVLLDE